MRYLAIILITAMLSACNGSDTDPADVDAQGVTAAQMQSAITAAVSAATHADAAQIASIQAQLTKVEQFGHAPGAPTASVNFDSKRTMAMLTEPAVTAAVSYGPCADMGQHIADSVTGTSGDPLGSLSEGFKQCPINGAQYEYEAVVETGAISTPPEVWFDGPNCTGNMLIFENDGSYNRQAMQSGVVFTSPADATKQLMILAQTDPNAIAPATRVSASIMNPFGVCTNDVETHVAYSVTSNNISITGVPAAVPSNFIY